MWTLGGQRRPFLPHAMFHHRPRPRARVSQPLATPAEAGGSLGGEWGQGGHHMGCGTLQHHPTCGRAGRVPPPRRERRAAGDGAWGAWGMPCPVTSPQQSPTSFSNERHQSANADGLSTHQTLIYQLRVCVVQEVGLHRRLLRGCCPQPPAQRVRKPAAEKQSFTRARRKNMDIENKKRSMC